jgi:hypothetical protein
VPSRERDSSFHGLVEAWIAISSKLTLDGLLQLLAETAAELTGARYAMLGVIDVTGRELERFITHGIDPETHAAIGDLPRGRGILGVHIRDARQARSPGAAILQLPAACPGVGGSAGTRNRHPAARKEGRRKP